MNRAMDMPGRDAGAVRLAPADGRSVGRTTPKRTAVAGLHVLASANGMARGTTALAGPGHPQITHVAAPETGDVQTRKLAQ